MTETRKVAAVQMHSSENLGDNLRLTDSLLADAARLGSELAVLPENFAFMGIREEDKLAIAEDENEGLIHEFLSDCSRRHGLWIVAGSLPMKSQDADRCYSASVVYDLEGRNRACYRKIHLFDVDLPAQGESYRESATTRPGDGIAIVDTPIGRLGLSICYDLRFPELYRKLVGGGATVFSVPSAFTHTTGTVHWHTLLRARAIENLAYVVAPAQFGKHSNGRSTFGHSLIVDPWGQVLAEKASGNAVVVADMNMDLVRRLRTEFPVLQHRRVGA